MSEEITTVDVTSQHIVINQDRSVAVPSLIKKTIVQHDHNIERLTFDCPRYWYGKDISTLNIYVNYISVSQKAKGDDPVSSLCENVVIDENDQDKMHFDWVITNNVSQDVGGLLFLVCAKSVDSDGNEDVHWNSHLCKDLEVQEGLEASAAIVEKYPDVIEQILSKLVQLEDIKGDAAVIIESNFRGSDTTANIMGKTGEAGDKWYSTDEGVYYMLSTSGEWINCGSGENLKKIEDEIDELKQRLNALADSDDTTLDQMSEVVAYIKSNKSLIDAITTSKVSVSDIIDNLTTNVSNKPLSAAQGVILKTMIDEITIPEKLPNPYSLTFTGSVAGIYDGSEALTINIPSGGDGSTYYVTPEQFGAIGDGVTDDSEAFRQAIETEKPIVCTYGKKYNCITEIVTEKTTINIIGNRCMLKNFHLKINVNSRETSWINAYPVPNSTIQDVNFNGTDKPEYCIKTGIPIKFLNCKWDFYDIMVKNYGSYMDYIVFENCAFKNHSGTHYAIDLAYLGDQHVFRECDFGGTGENRKFVSLSGCQSATIINCLFAGDHIIYSSNVVFIGCHMEGVSSITVGGDKTWDTILHFIDCYFWDMYTLSLADSSHFFDSCTFYISHQCIVGGRDYTLYNQKNCKILCATTSDPNSYVNLDDLVNRKEFPERKTLSNPCVYQSSAGAVAQGRNWPLNTGSYTYLFFPSTNPYSIDGWNFYYTKATLTFEISSDSSIVSFTGNSDFAGYYLWCYRTSPDGTIHRAIMPMHMDRFYDYGQYMNGIPWVEVDAIPDPKTSLATFKNGIYYSGDGSCNGKNCMCINTSNGLISYISNDGVVHQNEYVDASEVMY